MLLRCGICRMVRITAVTVSSSIMSVTLFSRKALSVRIPTSMISISITTVTAEGNDL